MGAVDRRIDLSLAPMENIDSSIGSITTGTNLAAYSDNGGAETICSTMTLNKGKYIVWLGGYSPIDGGGVDKATRIWIINGAFNTNISSSLTFMFCCCGVIDVTSDNTQVVAKVSNWEATGSTFTTSYTFQAMKIA